MKIISWNVNGIRAVKRKGFDKTIKTLDPDFVMIQEIKSCSKTIRENNFEIDGYISCWNSAKKKGYAGTAIYYKNKPLNIIRNIRYKSFDDEGRAIALEYDQFYLVNVYLPHTGRELKNLDKKKKFNERFLEFCNNLNKQKPLIVGGDFNVAHTDIDLARAKDNIRNAGFTPAERRFFTHFLDSGYIDTFRHFNKKPGNYTWWTYRFDARNRNIGWRIDYILVSNYLKKKLRKASILSKVYGSDHCPVCLEINI